MTINGNFRNGFSKLAILTMLTLGVGGLQGCETTGKGIGLNPTAQSSFDSSVGWGLGGMFVRKLDEALSGPQRYKEAQQVRQIEVSNYVETQTQEARERYERGEISKREFWEIRKSLSLYEAKERGVSEQAYKKIIDDYNSLIKTISN